MKYAMASAKNEVSPDKYIATIFVVHILDSSAHSYVRHNLFL